jgi:catechol 2,3-dioxygenase-like lactoylglutathione lyase family enzyme
VSVELNHTIVQVRDKKESATFLADILGLEVGKQWGPFLPVTTANGVSLDFADASEVHPQHYAFLVSDDEFDRGFNRIQAMGVRYFADPHGGGLGEINHLYGGRGVYFDDPSGHLMELITTPYGHPETFG